MKLKLITTLKYHWSKILSVFIFIILLGAYANIFAIGSPYSPGSTLNPECAPGEENCRVDTFQAEEDPTVSTYIKGITESYFTNGNTAYSWGDHSLAGYITGVSSSDITTALGYTPYNSTNPSNYISDAPSDSLLYARRNGAWTTFTVPTTYTWSYTVKDDGWINLVDNGKIVHFNSNDDSLDITTSLSSGHWYINSEVADDGHSHTSSSISGLSVSDFTSPNISNWTNNANYITDGNTGWDNSYGFLTSYTETDPIFTAWDKDYADLINTPTIPTNLSDLSDDTTHRTVTDTEKSTWNGKQDSLVSGTNIKTINSLSILGSGDLTIGGLASDANFNTKGGTSAGLNLVSGAQYNTFLGYEAGLSSATLSTNDADYNTAIGYHALYSNTTGSSNTANGFYSLYSNTTGNRNTANGNQSLYSNTTGYFNTANGFSSLYSNTTGYFNTANGYGSLNSSKTGSEGVAVGYQSQMYANDTTTPWTNTNTSVGYQSLRGSTTAANNTGVSNSAFGYQSMMNNTSGFHNTANGYNSLYSNTSGAYNVAIGHDSLYSNISGYSNVALGMSALNNNTTGGSNVAIGPSALHSNITGDSNVAVGNWAGTESSLGPNTTSSNSVYVGNGTRALFSGGFNEIVIGSNTTGNGSNTTTIGTGNVLYVGGSSITGKVARFTNSAGYCDVDPLNASLVCSSDITLKKNITTLKDIEYILNEQIDISSSNLEKLLTLTPVKYNWNGEADGTSKHTGFIAQEVEQLFPELVSTDENTELKSISYSGFTPYIVNAIKELNLKVEAISLDDDSNIFSSVIKKVENGIAYLTGLVVDTIVVGSQEKRTGITLYDEETGDPYCITIVNGEMINREGECGVVEMPDICPNIDEYQQEIPDGYELDENNECIEVYIEEKSIDSELENVDICSNIEGMQSNMPEGYNLGGNNECIKQDLKIPVDPSLLFTATSSQE